MVRCYNTYISCSLTQLPYICITHTTIAVCRKNSTLCISPKIRIGWEYFFYWSRITFITIYCSVVIFAGMLAFKGHYEIAIVFVAIMIFIVYRVDCSITNTFVLRSLQLPIKIVAEEVATEEAALLTEPICYDKEASFMYRNPILDQSTWQ